MAVDLGVIEKAGAWFKIVNPENGEYLTYEDGEVIKFQGQINLMAFLRENEQVYNYVSDYVMSKITGDKQEMLQVDAAADKEAVEDLKAEAVVASGGIVIAGSGNEETTEANVTRQINNDVYEAPSEIPMDDGVAV